MATTPALLPLGRGAGAGVLPSDVIVVLLPLLLLPQVTTADSKQAPRVPRASCSRSAPSGKVSSPSLFSSGCRRMLLLLLLLLPLQGAAAAPPHRLAT